MYVSLSFTLSENNIPNFLFTYPYEMEIEDVGAQIFLNIFLH